MVKPAGVRIEFEYQIKVIVETLVKWIYSVYEVPLCNQKLCGQYPRRGSLGEIMYIETSTDIEELRKVFELQKTGTIRVGGRLYDSTKGEIVTDDVQILINSQYEIEEVTLAGQIVSGTHPIQAVNGLMMGTSIEADRMVTNATASLPLSGTHTAGGGTMKDPALALIDGGVNVNPAVHVTAAIYRKCGPGQASTAQMTFFSESVEAEPTVQIATASVKRCGTGVCGNK